MRGFINMKIIADSSADLITLPQVPFTAVPLKIITAEKEYVDNNQLNVDEMVADLLKYKGTSRSSCPNADEWKEAFGDSNEVFCVTITSGLSGSCNAARCAVEEYLEEHPERKGMVIDTLSAGAEVALITEKLKELILKKLPFEQIRQEIETYKKRTHLAFALESMRNLANNGRVNPAVAKIAGVLGVRILGKASNEGTLEVTNKVRGKDKVLPELFKNMLANGYCGERVRIHHCQNAEGAAALKQMITEKFNKAEVLIHKTRGLCSFYAETGGLLVGYEGAVKQ